MKPLLSLLLGLCFLSASSQDTTTIMMKHQMLKEWERAKAYTDEYLEAMPADKYGFRPTDSVRSFAQQMFHLSFATVALITIGTGTSDTLLLKYFIAHNPENMPADQNKDSVVRYVNQSYDFAMRTINNMDFSKLSQIAVQRLPGGVRSETRLAWLLKAFEHQTHHRGQCTVYLRLVGVHPPAEKLF